LEGRKRWERIKPLRDDIDEPHGWHWRFSRVAAEKYTRANKKIKI